MMCCDTNYTDTICHQDHLCGIHIPIFRIIIIDVDTVGKQEEKR